MTRLIIICCLLMNLDTPGLSQVLASLSNAPGEILPGGHFTLFFDVQSGRIPAGDMQASLQLPEQWTLLSKHAPAANEAGRLRYFFVVGVPGATAAAGYPLLFEIQNQSEKITLPVTVTVREVGKMDMMVVSQPEYVREGDTLRVGYMIQNAGNKIEKLALKTSRGMVEGGADSLVIKPGEKAHISVAQVVPVTNQNAWQIASDLTAVAAGGNAQLFQTASIPVFSSKIQKIDRYFRFPVEVGGGYLTYTYGDSTISGYQYTAMGRGFVDQKQKHLIDFTVRGPNQFFFPAVGSYDQYSLDYQYKGKTFVSVGDYVLQLNNLMEFGRFGRGLRVEQQFDKSGYMLFAQRARFYMNQKESVGGKFWFKVGESATLAASYASKNVVFHQNQFWSHLLGASAQVRTKELSLETELAAGKANNKTDLGAFTQLRFVRSRFSTSVNVIYAGKNFYGFYNNSMLVSSNVGYNLTKKLTIGAGVNFSRLNPSLDATFYSVSPKDRSYMFYTSWQPDQRNRFYLYFSEQSRQDRLLPADFDYWERFGNLSYNFTGNNFTLFYQGRYGYARNRLVADNTGKKESFSNLAQPSVRVFKWAWVGGYFEHQHTSKFSRLDVIEDLFFYGGNARVNLRRNLSANFLYRNNYAPDELFERRSFVDLSVILDLNRHRFTLAGGRSYIPNVRNHAQNTLFLNLRYTLKLNVPLSRKKNLGRVHGRLTGEGFSKAGNLIRLGSHKFLTDTSGRFVFDGLAPDQYYLSVTQNDSRNEGVVPAIKMPLIVQVKPDSLNQIEIPFTRTGQVTGKVEFAKSQNGMSAIMEEKPVVLIKLSNEKTSYLTELHENGTFAFKEMVPGTWNISAFISGNQDRFLIDDSNRPIEIETGRSSEIAFRIRPNERRIHFSEKSFEVSVKK